jgi:hypothetical protein
MKKYEATINQIGETVEEIENGYGDVLLEYAQLKDLRNFIDEAIKQIESQAIDEASRMDGKTFKAHGYAFTVNAGRVAHIIASAKWHIDGQLSGMYGGENDPTAAIRNIQAQATRIGMPEVNAIADKAVAEIKNYVGFK